MCKGGPQVHPFDRVHTVFTWAQCAISRLPSSHKLPTFDSPLMPREDLSAQPSGMFVLYPGSTSRRQPQPPVIQPRKTEKTRRRNCHSCTSQISREQRGEASYPAGAEQTLWRVDAAQCPRRLIISSASLGTSVGPRKGEGQSRAFCLREEGARGRGWGRGEAESGCAQCSQGGVLEESRCAGDELWRGGRRDAGRLTWGWWMEA